jgi:parallel beta-helix repeat protein
VDAGGNTAVANGGPGVTVSGGASATTISGNVISGNLREGVLVDSASGTVLAGNVIGASATTLSAIPNAFEGVAIQAGATGSVIGGSDAAARNIISGNTGSGIAIRDSATSGTIVEGNFIGTDAAGLVALGNGQAGIIVQQAAGTRIGAGGDDITQLISSNGREGIFIEAAPDTLVGAGTAIGVGINGAPLGNQREGILAQNVNGAVIRPAVVSNSGLAGIALAGDSNGNVMVPVLASGNGDVPVDLRDSANGLLAPPTIEDRGAGTVSGIAPCSLCTVILYNAFSDPSQPEARVEFVMQVTAGFDGAFTATLPAEVRSSNVAAMTCTGTCAPGSSTSEISAVDTVVQVPIVEFVTSSSVASPGRNLEVQVRITTSDNQPTTLPVVGRFETVAGTALAGTDFTAQSGNFSFLTGARNGETRTISVPIRPGATAGRTFTIRLLDPSGGNLGDFLLAPGNDRRGYCVAAVPCDDAAAGTRLNVNAFRRVRHNDSIPVAYAGNADA